MTIDVFLNWLLSASGGGGLGVIGWQLVNWIDAHCPAFSLLRYDLKRAATFAIVAAFAAGVAAPLLLLADWLSVRAMPESPQAWVATLFEIGAYAVLSSQVAHGHEEAKREIAEREAWIQEVMRRGGQGQG